MTLMFKMRKELASKLAKVRRYFDTQTLIPYGGVFPMVALGTLISGESESLNVAVLSRVTISGQTLWRPLCSRHLCFDEEVVHLPTDIVSLTGPSAASSRRRWHNF